MNILAVDKVNRWGSPARITVAQLGFVALFGGIWAVCAGDSLAPPTNASHWTALVVTAVAGTALAYLAQAKALTVMPPSRVALIFTSEPVFAAMFGFWLAGDRFTALHLLGGALVVVAMLAAEFSDRRTGPTVAKERGVGDQERPRRRPTASNGWL
jgi:drug/metabolite transporter (DMT)-like permease